MLWGRKLHHNAGLMKEETTRRNKRQIAVDISKFFWSEFATLVAGRARGRRTFHPWESVWRGQNVANVVVGFARLGPTAAAITSSFVLYRPPSLYSISSLPPPCPLFFFFFPRRTPTIGILTAPHAPNSSSAAVFFLSPFHLLSAARNVWKRPGSSPGPASWFSWTSTTKTCTAPSSNYTLCVFLASEFYSPRIISSYRCNRPCVAVHSLKCCSFWFVDCFFGQKMLAGCFTWKWNGERADGGAAAVLCGLGKIELEERSGSGYSQWLLPPPPPPCVCSRSSWLWLCVC